MDQAVRETGITEKSHRFRLSRWRWTPLVLVGVTLGLACGRSGDLELGAGIRVESKIVDATADVGFFADLELNPDNVPTIAYYDSTNGDLKYAVLNRSTGEWDLEIIDETGDVGGFADHDYDSFGNPHIAYYDYTNAQIKYAFFNGLEWVIRVLDIPGEMEGYLSMEMDRNDVAHLAAISAGDFNLEYAVYDPENDVVGGTTVDDGTRTTGFGGNINQSVDITLRDVGNDQLPVIAYYHASHGLLQLAFMRRGADNSLGFDIQVLDGNPQPGAADIGQWAAIHKEDDNTFHFSYFDATNQDLKYGVYTFDNNEFISTAVDTQGIVGETSSVILDAEGRPAITYFDSTNNDLKLAVRVGTDRWQTFRVDLRGVVGSYSSLALMPQGNLGIAYRDTSREALIFSLARTN